MNPVTDPPRTKRRGPSTGPSAIRRLIDTRLEAKGLKLNELMPAWFEAGCPWPDILDRLENLTGERPEKNTLKRWFPNLRHPMPGDQS